MLKKLIWTFFGISVLSFVCAECVLRYNFYQKNINDPGLHNILFYSTALVRKPNTELNFRYYGPNAQLFMSADVNLNNMGLFSVNDYQIEKKENEYRILVLGGEQTASSVANKSWPDHLEEYLNKKQTNRVFKVINLGWPDAGLEHSQRYWDTEGKNFKPDLVILNYVETDFYRLKSGGHLKYRGKDVDSDMIQYSVGPDKDDIAQTATAFVKGHPVTSYRDPNALPSRPYGFFASKSLMSNREKVLKLQKTIASDMIHGSQPAFGRLLLNYLLNPNSSLPTVAEIKVFDPPEQIPTLSKEESINFGVKNIGIFLDSIPNLIVIHNFQCHEAIDKPRYELTEAVLKQDARIKVVDMRNLIPTQTTADEIKSWYYFPHMSEKWNDKGHGVYGEMVSKVVLDWINQHASENEDAE